jgi:5-formyltetrahydrofolate cyclo-ligase
MTKKEIRKQMLEMRSKFDRSEMRKKNRHIIQQIKHDKDYIDAKCVAIFYPMRNEVNLLELLNLKKTFAFPKIMDDGMHFIKYYPHQEFAASSFGVSEPITGDIVDDQIDYILTPALAISKKGYRVGYGKGFYDYFLAKHRPSHVVGVIYDFQEIDDFSINEHDQKLDRYIKG